MKCGENVYVYPSRFNLSCEIQTNKKYMTNIFPIFNARHCLLGTSPITFLFDIRQQHYRDESIDRSIDRRKGGIEILVTMNHNEN